MRIPPVGRTGSIDLFHQGSTGDPKGVVLSTALFRTAGSSMKPIKWRSGTGLWVRQFSYDERGLKIRVSLSFIRGICRHPEKEIP
jgi:hypothetical protein